MLAIFYPIDAAHLLFRLIILGTIFYPLPQAFALDMNAEIERLFKPRQRVDVNNWQLEPQTTRKRGVQKTRRHGRRIDFSRYGKRPKPQRRLGNINQ